MSTETFDFGGYATRNDIRCTDGRIIRKDAFKKNDGTTVPLVWQHNHDSPSNVLGHGLLENREDGVYVYGKFNDTEMGQQAKELVKHGDMTRLSIYANRLKENNHNVIHGEIREVSLVYAGANDGAYIDTISFAHEDGSEIEEAIMYSGDDISLDISHAEEKEETKVATEEKKSDRTIQDVINGMTEEQKNVLYYLVGNALDGGIGDSDDNVEHGDDYMKYNVFDGMDDEDIALSHMEALEADTEVIFADAKRCGSLKESFLAHADTNGTPGTDYGITDLDIFLPDYRDVNGGPETVSREMDWVSVFMNATSKSPFSRIKTTAIDITDDKARALGYKKGTKKKEELFKAMKRTTDPTTIYKKNKIDRDDLADITGWDVVAYMKNEMKTMLDEEIARAGLIGDGREKTSDDHISQDHIRPIYLDTREFTRRVLVDFTGMEEDETKEVQFLIDTIIKSRPLYKGSGNPIFFTTDQVLSAMLLLKDSMGHYIYKSENDLATTLRVSRIVTVPVMEGLEREFDSSVTDKNVENTPYAGKTGKKFVALGIYVNPKDYTWGMDRLGAVSFFDDFDIDYNQQKYLMETRRSGALKKMFSALVFEVEKKTE